MSSSILSKIVLLIVGVLVLVQLLFYAAVRVGNNDRSENERVRLALEIENLSVTQSELQQYLGQLQKEYKEMAASVPTRILEGYEDPEVGRSDGITASRRVGNAVARNRAKRRMRPLLALLGGMIAKPSFDVVEPLS